MSQLKRAWQIVRQEWIPAVIIAAAVVSSALGLTVWRGFFNRNSGSVEVVALIALILITGLYGWHTRQVARAAREQSEASWKMTEEVREQRLALSQPTIIQKAVYKPTRHFSHFILWNTGTGPALEVEISLLDQERNALESNRETFLRAGEERQFAPTLVHRPEGKHYVACEYRTIRPIDKGETRDQTWLPFELAKASAEGDVYVLCGELEFRFRVPREEWIDAFQSRGKPR